MISAVCICAHKSGTRAYTPYSLYEFGVTAPPPTPPPPPTHTQFRRNVEYKEVGIYSEFYRPTIVDLTSRLLQVALMITRPHTSYECHHCQWQRVVSQRAGVTLQNHPPHLSVICKHKTHRPFARRVRSSGLGFLGYVQCEQMCELLTDPRSRNSTRTANIANNNNGFV